MDVSRNILHNLFWSIEYETQFKPFICLFGVVFFFESLAITGIFDLDLDLGSGTPPPPPPDDDVAKLFSA